MAEFVEMSIKRLPKTTRKQYEELIDYLEEHKIMLTARTKPLEAKKILKMWSEFADVVNSTGYGPYKTGKQWRKIFNEWKINTRRKCREIRLALMETGGEPPIKKELSDIERRLMLLITAPHLRDKELPEAGLSVVKCETPSISVESDTLFMLPDCDAQTYAERLVNSIVELPQLISNKDDEEQAMQKEELSSPTGEKEPDTNSILKDACETYTAVPIEQPTLINLKANAINNLSYAVTQLAESFKLRARAELAKAKVEYFKITGSLDGFDEFL